MCVKSHVLKDKTFLDMSKKYIFLAIFTNFHFIKIESKWWIYSLSFDQFTFLRQSPFTYYVTSLHRRMKPPNWSPLAIEQRQTKTISIVAKSTGIHETIYNREIIVHSNQLHHVNLALTGKLILKNFGLPRSAQLFNSKYNY